MERISFVEFKRATHHKIVLLETAWGPQGIVSIWIEKFYANKGKHSISMPGVTLGREGHIFRLDAQTFVFINPEHKTQTLIEVFDEIPEDIKIQLEKNKAAKKAKLKKQIEERTLRSAISYLQNQQVLYKGEIMTMKAWLDAGIETGFVHLSEKRRGAVPLWHLANEKGTFWTLKRKEEKVYVEHILANSAIKEAA